MNRRDMLPRRPRPGHRTVLVGALVLLLPAQVFVGVGRRAPAEPGPAPRALGAGPALDPTLPLVPTERPAARARPEPPAPTPARPAPSVEAYAGLGVWVDLFDYADIDPYVVVPSLAARGVNTIYVQTGRYNTATQVDPGVDGWLLAGHAAGMKVVGWYLPGYRQMAMDTKRMLAAAHYEVDGHRFDSVGVDIEYKELVPDPTEWNARVVEHMRRVRADLPADYPFSAIVPPPLQMDVAPLRWAGFPWRGIAEQSDVIMLMSYWSYRDCPNTPDHCAYPFTRKNVEITRQITGLPELPVHTIGGVGDRITLREVEEFADGAIATGAYGASLYDLRTTAPAYWEHLERLKNLG